MTALQPRSGLVQNAARALASGALAAVQALALAQPAAPAPTPSPTPVPAAAPAALAAAPDNFADRVNRQAMLALWWGDFEALRSLYTQARASNELTRLGRQAIGSFSLGVGRVFGVGTPDASEAYFINLEGLTADWLRQNPGDPLAVALHARAQYARAWWYRGDGYANTVSPQQMALFERHIQRALATLTAQAAAPDDVMSHVYLVMILRAASVNFRDQQRVAERVFAQRPDAIGLWAELLNSAVPKWGGSWSLVNAVIRDAAARQADATSGDILYALLWLAISGDASGQFFEETRVDWARLQRGLDAVLQRRESDALRNSYASLACLRQDPVAARRQLELLGRRVDVKEWIGHSDGKAAYDLCRSWLRQNP
jgi:hypothetical protein